MLCILINSWHGSEIEPVALHSLGGASTYCSQSNRKKWLLSLQSQTQVILLGLQKRKVILNDFVKLRITMHTHQVIKLTLKGFLTLKGSSRRTWAGLRYTTTVLKWPSSLFSFQEHLEEEANAAGDQHCPVAHSCPTLMSREDLLEPSPLTYRKDPD